MRNCVVFALLAMVSMVAAERSPTYDFKKTADMDYLQKQKKVFDLLMYVDGTHTDAEYFEIGRNYDIMTNVDYYMDKDVVYEFVNMYKIGMLRKDGLFTYYKQEHREEMMLLYRLFYVAKDFATFYKTACWARVHMNHGMFVTAFTTAVIYRDDTKYIRLPAIYEIYPNMFFDTKVIRDAIRMKMTRGSHNMGMDMMMMKRGDAMTVDNGETYYVTSNFTDVCMNPMYELEYKMNYFMEDVDLNAFYYYFRMTYPFWMDTKDYKLPRFLRGDIYYFFHKQIMSRYYLERLSNDLGLIEDFTFDRMDLPGFVSDISFTNGMYMPRRDWWNVVPFYKLRILDLIKNLEVRVMDAIDSGYVYDEQGKQVSIYTPEGLNHLGNLIEGNCDSYNMKYYGAYDALARDLLGQNMDCKCKDYYVPSSLQLFSTSMRDPAFYRLYDRILYFFQRYKAMLNRYTKNELEFPGVKIENVEVDKMVTFFDKKEYLINNAVAVDSFKEGKSFNIKTWQYSLNYKPFTYKFAVNSDKDTRGVMRIFLGPAVEGEKYDYYTYLLNYYQYFFMLDEFQVDLKPGMNTIERHSIDSYFFKHNYMTGDVYYKKIMKALQGQEPFSYNERMWAFPGHLMLPKGTVDGMRFKLFCYIGPYEEPKVYEMPILGTFKFYGKSLGFPLDRPVNPYFLQMDNLYFKDVIITHIKDYTMDYRVNYNSQMKDYLVNYRDYNTKYMTKDYDMKYIHNDYDTKYQRRF
ncbi:arylphorin subunit alpha-like [Phymastichus coffea]|uniref:arylphorin subunit alpha-like n=1 Tax=Phymastichus coffea TaxID=108790 RepID=UPI00273B2056|nr:arylphorin subunit alpha-like [Phymastichus coffea]